MNDILKITKTDNISYIQFKRLLVYENLFHAYSMKENNFGIKKEDGIIVNNSLDRISDNFNIDTNKIVYPIQRHTGNVQEYKEGIDLENTDGLTTNRKGLMLLTTYADCMPLLFYDPIKNVITNVHSGWKGTVQKIGINAIDKMVKLYDCKKEDIICCIGPTIKKDHFLVNEDVKEQFMNVFNDLNKRINFIEETDLSNEIGRQYRIDCTLLNKTLFKEFGLKEENIVDCDICTVCNEDTFHSRRAEGENYQLDACLMMLK